MTFLCYAGLLRSLPNTLQRQVDKWFIKKPNIPYRINLVLNNKKITKLAYNVFLARMSANNNVSNEHLHRKWLVDIGDYNEGTLEKVSKSTTSTYLIYNHFRIINRIYATNKHLFNINITENDRCTFCERAEETIVHLFWFCSKIQTFIK